MLKIFFIAFLIPLVIILFLVILIKNRRQAIHTYSIQTFLGNSTYNLLDEEPNEQKKTLIERINVFFKDSNDKNIDDGNDDIGDDGDDAGE